MVAVSTVRDDETSEADSRGRRGTRGIVIGIVVITTAPVILKMLMPVRTSDRS